ALESGAGQGAEDHRGILAPLASTAQAPGGTQSTSGHLPGFGTGPGLERALNVVSALGPAPVILTPADDDGSILTANATGLQPGQDGAASVQGFIGDGPHGSAGSGRGDYDHYAVPLSAGQVLSLDVDALLYGSTLNAALGVYNSAGQL